MRVGGPDTPVMAEKYIPNVDDGFENDYDASEYTLENETVEAEELHSSKNDNSEVRYVADIIVCVNKKVARHWPESSLHFFMYQRSM